MKVSRIHRFVNYTYIYLSESCNTLGEVFLGDGVSSDPLNQTPNDGRNGPVDDTILSKITTKWSFTVL